MKRTTIKVLWALAAIALAISLLFPQYLYLRGLGDVPTNREPLTGLTIPESVSQAYWRYLGGEGKPEVVPKSPHRFLLDFFVMAASADSSHRSSAEYSLLSQAARSLMFREEFSGAWHLSNASALIWISRNWSVEESITTVLVDEYFGNGLQSIDAAALGYFGTSLERLDEAQIIYLLVMTPAPSRLSPWCYPEYHRKVFNSNSERIGLEIEYDSLEILPIPPGACD